MLIPCKVENEPGRHSEQKDDPEDDEYEPAGHEEHDMLLERYIPGEHSVHTDEADTDVYDPTLHFKHADCPSFIKNDPKGQPKHVEALNSKE